MVRSRGLEPPHLAALDPKSSVYTNFTTTAKHITYYGEPERTRTSGLRLRRALLYPAELRTHNF